jgi:hypothetical protein
LRNTAQVHIISAYQTYENIYKERCIFVMEHVGMPFWKFFFRRMQPGTAFQNLLFLGSV